MDSNPCRAVTDAEIDAFWRDGVVCLPGVLSGAWLDTLVEPIEALLGHPSTVDVTGLAEALRNGSTDRILEDDVGGNGAGGRYFVHTGSDVDAIRRFEMTSMVPEIASRVLRSTFVDLFVDQILVKEPGSPTRTAFHVDESYFNVSGDKVCTVWIPLDPVTVESGAMGYVRGSHRWEEDYLPNNFVSQATRGELPGRTKLPDIEGHADQFDIIYFDVEPGDVILHHYRTAHGSGGNTTRDRRRRALAVRYVGDDVRWQPTEAVTGATGIRMFDNSLAPGDLLDEAQDVFPRCWTAPDGELAGGQ